MKWRCKGWVRWGGVITTTHRCCVALVGFLLLLLLLILEIPCAFRILGILNSVGFIDLSVASHDRAIGSPLVL